jgi:chemotaxis signal transduction protein
MATARTLAHHYLVFEVDDCSYAVPLDCVERVIPAVWVSPVNNRPPRITGVINVHGVVVPVIDPSARAGAEPRTLNYTDHFVIVQSRSHKKALWIGSHFEVVQSSGDESGEAVGRCLGDDGEFSPLLVEGVPVALLDPDAL